MLKRIERLYRFTRFKFKKFDMEEEIQDSREVPDGGDSEEVLDGQWNRRSASSC
jgi:hypothetical protein